MLNFDVDVVVKQIKNLVDSIRCGVCDKTNGIRMRYACGHTSCEECAAVAVDCSLCFTPITSYQEPVIDKALTARIENILHLLNVFQDVFHIDVYKRQRLSEQLKIEKELFPECIQAPVKYFNKRKSSQSTNISNKENRLSQLPGERIPSVLEYKMEHNNVEQWLNKHVRKPLSDINTNVQKYKGGLSIKKSYNTAIDSENNPLYKLQRKRPFMKTVLSRTENQYKQDKKQFSAENKNYKNSKRPKIEIVSYQLRDSQVEENNKHENHNESGIVLDDEEAIVIEDSQSVTVDKDLAAIKAVEEAEFNNKHDSATVFHSIPTESLANMRHITIPKSKTEELYKVPFYLKSNLAECNNLKSDKSTHLENGRKDICITIENKCFLATIEVRKLNDNCNKEINKQSVEVQTEVSDDEGIDNVDHNEDMVFEKDILPAFKITNTSLANENKQQGHNTNNKNIETNNKSGNVIINESDSDEDLGASMTMSVTAEIHRSCEEIDYGILAAVDNLVEHGKRARRAARGQTPASTDSSEKENFNPNRRKKTICPKKKPMKKLHL